MGTANSRRRMIALNEYFIADLLVFGSLSIAPL
jgi:hypothetical protein